MIILVDTEQLFDKFHSIPNTKEKILMWQIIALMSMDNTILLWNSKGSPTKLRTKDTS